jgi:hypothetical protein
MRCASVKTLLLAMASAVPLAVFSVSQARQPLHKIWETPSATIRLQLFDAFSGAPLAAIQIECEGPIYARPAATAQVRPPGPSPVAQQWSGHSNASGLVAFPRSAILRDCRVKTQQYESTYLHDACSDSASTTGSGWRMELFPDRLGKEGLSGMERIKLIDGRTGKPLANMPVRVEFPATGILESKTNALGYVFFPLERTISGKPSKPDMAWVIVPGYGKATFNFEFGPPVDRCGTKLRRQ